VRLPEAPDVPTLAELGTPVEFVNWRGFFAPPGLARERLDAWIALFEELLATPEWEEVRRRNGWIEIFHAGPAFEAFLVEQEQELADLMASLGMHTATELE
jgi:putative tricarboxylic transport membrane protein